MWEGRNKRVWFRQGLVKSRCCCPFKLEQASWNAEAIDASAGTKLLNAGMDNQWCFYLLLACCPVGIVLSCGWSPVICTNFHHQGTSFLIQCFLYGLCDVSGECLLPFSVLVLSLGVCAHGSFWLSSALVSCELLLFSEHWCLPLPWLLLFPILSDAERDWIKYVHWNYLGAHTHTWVLSFRIS